MTRWGRKQGCGGRWGGKRVAPPRTPSLGMIVAGPNLKFERHQAGKLRPYSRLQLTDELMFKSSTVHHVCAPLSRNS